MEAWIVSLFIIIPFTGFGISLLLPEKKESWISGTTFVTASIQMGLSILFISWWILHSAKDINIPEIVLYRSDHYIFLIDFFFDKITAVYLFTASFLTFLISRYSRYYLHREYGYKRFFNTILLFFSGYHLTVFAGNFETLFMGWEILGLSSFLLIAFYRNRYLPVRNAVKVFTIYRIGDVGILLAMWASHHLWHENITFLKLGNALLVHEHLKDHSTTGLFIALMILLAAAVKSAQLPFSSWLPRAMEGPTPSSAIFYGSLSVHLGVFLLHRTYPFWENQLVARAIILLVGLLTAVTSFFIARVQSNIKSQIAYASISQIGIMFMEISLGLQALALLHFMGNAFLRSYQLLVSPAVVSYRIREQLYSDSSNPSSFEDFIPRSLRFSLYVLSLKEWNLDFFLNRYIFSPLKKAGHNLDFIHLRNIFFIFIPVFFLSLLVILLDLSLPDFIKLYLPQAFVVMGLLMVLKSFSERRSYLLAWCLVSLHPLWVTLAMSFHLHFDWGHTILYLSGVVPASIGGGILLYRLTRQPDFPRDLNQYHGRIRQYPVHSVWFLLFSLGLMGFPVSLSFIGEDLIFSHIEAGEVFMAGALSLGYVISGISLIRIYARVFLGPDSSQNYSVPLKSS
jgi:NADH-quinone oxidoreductase subunit L